MGLRLDLALPHMSTWGGGHSGRSEQLSPASAAEAPGRTLHSRASLSADALVPRCLQREELGSPRD